MDFKQLFSIQEKAYRNEYKSYLYFHVSHEFWVFGGGGIILWFLNPP